MSEPQKQPTTPPIRTGQSLCGVRVMITRPATAGDPLGEQLRALGAEVVPQPAIAITDPPDWRPVDDALSRLDTFDWLVFSSANGVRYLLERLRQLEGTDDVAKKLAAVKLAAIGPGTAEELARYHLRADFVPERFCADALADALCHHAKGDRFLLARASRGREVLGEQLAAAGAEVEQIVVYSSIDVATPDPQVAAMLVDGRIDWITVTSSAIARSLVRMFGEHLRRSRLASISPLTSGVLRELGYEPAAEAEESTMPCLVARIVKEQMKIARKA